MSGNIEQKAKRKKIRIPSPVIAAAISAIALMVSAWFSSRAQNQLAALELTRSSFEISLTQIVLTQSAFISTQTPFESSRLQYDSTQSAFELTQTSFEASRLELASTQSAFNSTQSSFETLRSEFELMQTASAAPKITESPSVESSATSPALLCTRDNSFGWEFDGRGNTEGWKNGRRLFGTTTRDGALAATIADRDPYWVGPNGLNIDASLYTIAEIRYRIDAFDDTAQFMWTTDTLFDNQWIEFDIITDNSWNTAIVNLPTTTNWAGIVTTLRLDPVKDASAGTVEIDYIRLCNPYQ